MARLLTLALCGGILLTSLAASASPESDLQRHILDITRKTPPDAADHEQFLLLVKDDPYLIFHVLHQVWTAAKENHDFRLEAQTGWYIARAASYSMHDNPGWDMKTLFKDTIRQIENHELPISTKLGFCPFSGGKTNQVSD